MSHNRLGMNCFVFLLVCLKVCSAYIEVNCEESCEKCQNKSSAASSFFFSNSIIYELTNYALGADFESNQCYEELVIIKKGIDAEDVWAIKREFN